jgi:DNA-binding Lrp family transcriptional regulator
LLDSLDRRLLAALRENGALTAAALGGAIGLSPSAAHRRVKLLEANGMITGYRARLSASARGDPSTIFVAVTLKDQSQATLGKFEQAVRRCQDIIEAHLMTGESDYLLKVAIPSDDTFERVHRDILAQLPGVLRLVSQFSIRAIVEAD